MVYKVQQLALAISLLLLLSYMRMYIESLHIESLRITRRGSYDIQQYSSALLPRCY